MPVTRRQRRGIAPAITGDASSLTQAESHKAPKALNGPEFIEASVISSVIELLDHSWVQNHWEVLDVPTSPCKVPDPLVDSLKGTDTAPESIDEDDPLALPDENTPPSPEVSPDGSACHESSTSESSDSGVVEAMVHSEQDPTALARMIESNKFLKSQRAEEETFDIANDTSPPTHLMCDVSDACLPSALDSDEVAIKIEVTEDNGFTPPLASAVGDVALKMEIKTDDPEGVGGVAEAVTDTDAGDACDDLETWTTQLPKQCIEDSNPARAAPRPTASGSCGPPGDSGPHHLPTGKARSQLRSLMKVRLMRRTTDSTSRARTIASAPELVRDQSIGQPLLQSDLADTERTADPAPGVTSTCTGPMAESAQVQPELNSSYTESGRGETSVKGLTKRRRKLQWQCCNETFSSGKKLKEHAREAHANDKPFKCDLCSRRFMYERCMEQHRTKHFPASAHVCEICETACCSKPSLKRHRLRHFRSGVGCNRPQENGYQCGVCARTFSTKTNLNYHSFSHVTEKKFPCGVCGKKFYTKGDASCHAREHRGKSSTCDTCGKSFTRKWSLIVHSRTHTGEKPYKCDICSETFPRKDVLRIHETKLHSEKRPFSCGVCQLSFCVKSSLESHMVSKRHKLVADRKAQQEETFPCNACNRAFISQDLLDLHTLKHSAKSKKFKCRVCDRHFTSRSYAKQHENIHTGVRPFKCETCGATFTFSGALYAHRLRLHEH